MASASRLQPWRRATHRQQSRNDSFWSAFSVNATETHVGGDRSHYEKTNKFRPKANQLINENDIIFTKTIRLEQKPKRNFYRAQAEEEFLPVRPPLSTSTSSQPFCIREPRDLSQKALRWSETKFDWIRQKREQKSSTNREKDKHQITSPRRASSWIINKKEFFGFSIIWRLIRRSTGARGFSLLAKTAEPE